MTRRALAAVALAAVALLPAAASQPSTYTAVVTYGGDGYERMAVFDGSGIPVTSAVTTDTRGWSEVLAGLGFVMSDPALNPRCLGPCWDAHGVGFRSAVAPLSVSGDGWPT